MTTKRYTIRTFDHKGDELDEIFFEATNLRLARRRAFAIKATAPDVIEVLIFDNGYLILRAELLGPDMFLLDVR